MVENIVDAGDHLVPGQGEGVVGVQDGELGHHVLVLKDLAHLFLGVGVRDDAAGVHLGPGAHHGQHTAQGDDGAGRLLKADEILLPGVLLAVDGGGHGLGVVADGPAAHGQQKVGPVPAADLHALQDLGQGGVGHDAGNFRHVLAAILQDGGHLVIDAVLLDGPAAVDQDDIGAVFGQLVPQRRDGAAAEIELGGVIIGEVS